MISEEGRAGKFYWSGKGLCKIWFFLTIKKTEAVCVAMGVVVVDVLRSK